METFSDCIIFRLHHPAILNKTSLSIIYNSIILHPSLFLLLSSGKNRRGFTRSIYHTIYISYIIIIILPSRETLACLHMWRDNRDSVYLCVRSLKMIQDASSNCHPICAVYPTTCTVYVAAQRLDGFGVCSVNDLSAYVLLTSSSGSGKHVSIVRHTEICTRHPTDLRSKDRQRRSRFHTSAFKPGIRYLERADGKSVSRSIICYERYRRINYIKILNNFFV